MEEKEIKEIIKKHIGGWNVDVMRQSSIDSFAESGRISGGFLIAVKSMMQEYAEHYHKAQQLPTVSDLTKNNILELLNAYKSEVDNFNDAIFIDKFNALAIDILKLSTLTKSAEKPSEEGDIVNLIDFLGMHGGHIISSNDLDTESINQARASERMYVNENGFGFVWIPEFQGGFPTTEDEVALFEKCYPLKVEMPKELKEFKIPKGYEQCKSPNSVAPLPILPSPPSPSESKDEKPSEEKECETCKNKEKDLVSGLCQCCWATENL